MRYDVEWNAKTKITLAGVWLVNVLVASRVAAFLLSSESDPVTVRSLHLPAPAVLALVAATLPAAVVMVIARLELLRHSRNGDPEQRSIPGSDTVGLSAHRALGSIIVALFVLGSLIAVVNGVGQDSGVYRAGIAVVTLLSALVGAWAARDLWKITWGS